MEVDGETISNNPKNDTSDPLLKTLSELAFGSFQKSSVKQRKSSFLKSPTRSTDRSATKKQESSNLRSHTRSASKSSRKSSVSGGKTGSRTPSVTKSSKNGAIKHCHKNQKNFRIQKIMKDTFYNGVKNHKKLKEDVENSEIRKYSSLFETRINTENLEMVRKELVKASQN